MHLFDRSAPRCAEPANDPIARHLRKERTSILSTSNAHVQEEIYPWQNPPRNRLLYPERQNINPAELRATEF